jgi:hypothetical protein
MTGRNEENTMNENENQLAVANPQPTSFVLDEDEKFIADLTSRKMTFCSMHPEDDEGRAKLFNAMNAPEYRLKDEINMTIKAKDLFCEVVQLVDKDTGETKSCPRIVIIDDEGLGHACVSLGIHGAIKKIIEIYGVPTWERPIPLKIKSKTLSADRTVLTLEVEYVTTTGKSK